MRVPPIVVAALTLGAWLGHGLAAAQPRVLSDAECQTLRQRLADHARLSDGVRRSVATTVAASPAAPAPATPAAPASRADAIRARLDQVAKERQVIEDQRLAAVVRLDLARAAQLEGQRRLLETEKTNLEKELAALPAGGTAPAPATPAPTPAPAPAATAGSDTDRIRCQDIPGVLDTAVKIRQRELGAREGQAGAIPLVAFKGQSADQIAQELAAQLGPWPAAQTQVGLLDNDGDGRLDGFVDVPVPDVYRLYRQRSDGSLSVETFIIPGRSGGYSEVVRRLDEATARQTGRTLTDLLAMRPAGSERVLAESSRFAETRGHLMAGNFAEAAKVEGGVARTVELQNFRGESIRILEMIAPGSTGLIIRQVVAVPRLSNQEQWDEIVTQIRPVSFFRTDVEVSAGRETRTAAGALVGTRSSSPPAKFSLER